MKTLQKLTIMYNAVIQRIKIIYETLGLTQSHFSKQCDLSQSTVNGWYRLNKIPSVDAIKSIVAAYPNISLDWLILGEGDMYNEQNTIMENEVIQRINQMLKEMNISVSELATRIGKPQTTVNNWLIAKRKPQMDFIFQILNSFENVSAEWLLRGEGNMFKSNNNVNNINNSNVVNGNGNSNISQNNGGVVVKKGLSAKLIAALLRGCPKREEQDEMIQELDDFVKNNS